MKKRTYFGFAALEASYWCFGAAFTSFLTAYFLQNGVGNTTLSLLMAAYMLCSFVGAIFWGGVCDALHTNKRVFVGCLTVTAALMFVLYGFGGNVAVLAVAYPMLGFFFAPMGVGMDAWVLTACNHDQRFFGPIRATPSLFYAFVAAYVGRMIARHGYYVTLIGGSIFMVLTILLALNLPDGRSVSAGRQKMGRAECARLLGCADYRRLVLLLFLVGLSVGPLLNLKAVILENVGGDVTHIGMDSFVSALTQVPFFALSGLIVRIPRRIRYASMTLLPMGMALCDWFAAEPGLVILGSFVYNAGLGILLPTMREESEILAPKELRNLAHGVSDAAYGSFSGMISLMYAGAVVDFWGMKALLMLSLLIGACAVATALLPGRKK